MKFTVSGSKCWKVDPVREVNGHFIFRARVISSSVPTVHREPSPSPPLSPVPPVSVEKSPKKHLSPVKSCPVVKQPLKSSANYLPPLPPLEEFQFDFMTPSPSLTSSTPSPPEEPVFRVPYPPAPKVSNGHRLKVPTSRSRSRPSTSPSKGQILKKVFASKKKKVPEFPEEDLEVRVEEILSSMREFRFIRPVSPIRDLPPQKRPRMEERSSSSSSSSGTSSIKEKLREAWSSSQPQNNKRFSKSMLQRLRR